MVSLGHSIKLYLTVSNTTLDMGGYQTQRPIGPNTMTLEQEKHCASIENPTQGMKTTQDSNTK